MIVFSASYACQDLSDFVRLQLKAKIDFGVLVYFQRMCLFYLYKKTLLYK